MEQASEVVFLVVVLQEHFIWKPQISMLHVKLAVGILYEAGFFISKLSLRTLYYSLVNQFNTFFIA